MTGKQTTASQHQTPTANTRPLPAVSRSYLATTVAARVNAPSMKGFLVSAGWFRKILAYRTNVGATPDSSQTSDR